MVNLNNNVLRMVLAALLMELTKDQKKRSVNFLWHLQQNGSCGDGSFDRAVKEEHNKDCDTAAEIVKNPFVLLRG